jgi:hypothetical protein
MAHVGLWPRCAPCVKITCAQNVLPGGSGLGGNPLHQVLQWQTHLVAHLLLVSLLDKVGGFVNTPGGGGYWCIRSFGVGQRHGLCPTCPMPPTQSCARRLMPYNMVGEISSVDANVQEVRSWFLAQGPKCHSTAMPTHGSAMGMHECGGWASKERIILQGSEPLQPPQKKGSSQKAAKHCSTRGSQVIPQPSTNQAQPRLTSEF